jgi:maltooligosyltrehalose trehalohydrolase
LRYLTSPGRHRALVALLLLGPHTPMLFQGEEYGSSRPFLFFADHAGDLGAKVREGRAKFLAQFPAMKGRAAQRALDDPTLDATFLRCKLDPAERDRDCHVQTLYRDLLRLRAADRAFSQQRGDRVHGCVLAAEAFLLRFMCEDGDRLLVVNLGRGLHFGSIPDPLVAAPRGLHWSVLLATEHPDYGGDGVAPVDADDGWHLGAHQAWVLAPDDREDRT